MKPIIRKESLDFTFNAFEQFQNLSGLKVNFDKTEIFPIGALSDAGNALYTDKNVKWNNRGVKVLGIHISHNHKEMMGKKL